MDSQTIMIWIISHLPDIYVIMTGVLISWGVMILIAYQSIFHYIARTRGRTTRSSDRMNYRATSAVLAYNTLILLFLPSICLLYVDVLILINLWIAVYFVFIVISSLRRWPELMFRDQDETVVGTLSMVRS